MVSVSNCQKEIVNCHAIRWLKCKLNLKHLTIVPYIHVLLHIYANVWLKFQNLAGKKMDSFLTSQKSSKIGTFLTNKWPISDIFKNPNQGM